MSNSKKLNESNFAFKEMTANGRKKELLKKNLISNEGVKFLSFDSVLDKVTANGMIENVVGTFELPIGIATNFFVNGKEYFVPMVIEEPSVVAAASFMAKIIKENGGFQTCSTPPIMRSQIQILDLTDPKIAIAKIIANKKKIIGLANECDPILVNLGGGCLDLETHLFEKTRVGPMVVVHLLTNVCDAMGANTVNTMAEAVSPFIEKITGGRIKLRILSNLADKRLSKASVKIHSSSFSSEQYIGVEVAKGIEEACALAEVDPYRAATHNKGIMNGIDPLLIATGNDWRAIEAGAHAWASRDGTYKSLTKWEVKGEYLFGVLESPMAVGIVGGTTRTHPTATANLELLNIKSARELAELAVSVGLAQNLAALRALSTEGIQKGHMKLHARNLAVNAGAKEKEIEYVISIMKARNKISVEYARLILDELHSKK